MPQRYTEKDTEIPKDFINSTDFLETNRRIL